MRNSWDALRTVGNRRGTTIRYWEQNLVRHGVDVRVEDVALTCNAETKGTRPWPFRDNFIREPVLGTKLTLEGLRVSLYTKRDDLHKPPSIETHNIIQIHNIVLWD